jgi:hypothetical protein
MEPMLWLAIAATALGAVNVLISIRDEVLRVRAERTFVRVLVESDEYRPLIAELKAREERQGDLEIGEHEAIDLRHRIREALVHLPRRDRRRVEARLNSPTVRGREFFLYQLLQRSIDRLEHQA